MSSSTPRPAPERSGGCARRVALVLVGLLVALGGAELLLRAFVSVPRPVRFVQNEEMLERTGRGSAAAVLEHDAELFWRLVPGLTLPPDAEPIRGLVANEQGLREDHEIRIPKPPQELRLLFVGDSCTFGTGLLHTESIVERTEQLLRERFPGVPIEAINAGVPGYSLFQGKRFLDARGFALEPDLIVVTFGWNGLSEWDGLSDPQHLEASRAARPPASLSWSRLARLAWTAASSHAFDAVDNQPRLAPAEFRSLLDESCAAARAHKVDMVGLIWPARFNIDPDTEPSLRSLLQTEMYAFRETQRQDPRGGALVVDLVPVARELARDRSQEDVFLDQIHGTALACEAYAAELARNLDAWVRQQLSTRH